MLSIAVVCAEKDIPIDQGIAESKEPITSSNEESKIENLKHNETQVALPHTKDQCGYWVGPSDETDNFVKNTKLDAQKSLRRYFLRQKTPF